MKLFENVLSEKLFDDIVKDLYSRLDKGVWSSSRFAWPDHIKNHIIGSTNWTDVKKSLAHKILTEFKEYYPYKDENKIAVMYYVMNPNAGISVHHDEDHYSWNATIYLNQDWDPDWGGLLLWSEDDTYFKGLVPKKNRMVVFDTNVSHIVTPVAHTSPQERATIQIREWRKTI
jgi:hypothetical protein